MKPIEKKDLPKLYVLIGLAVCVLGFAIFQFSAGMGSTPASASTTVKADDAKAGAPGSAAGAVAGTPGAAPGVAGFDVALVGPPSGGKDPFLPAGPAKPENSVALPPARPVAGAAARPLTGLAGLLASVAPMPKPSVSPVELSKPVAVVVPVPDLKVTGVVLGDLSTGVTRNVAILRGGQGDEDRRFVSVGDPVGNGFRVAAVHADGVEIEDSAGNRRVTLRLGKSGEDVRAN
jgi:hypothetical protein